MECVPEPRPTTPYVSHRFLAHPVAYRNFLGEGRGALVVDVVFLEEDLDGLLLSEEVTGSRRLG